MELIKIKSKKTGTHYTWILIPCKHKSTKNKRKKQNKTKNKKMVKKKTKTNNTQKFNYNH